MATVVDALTVTLGLDASGFKRDSERAGSSLRDLQVDAQKLSDKLKREDEIRKDFFNARSKELNSLRETSSRTAKGMQADGGRAAEFFSSIKIEALALLGVLTGGAGLIMGFKDTAAGLNAVNRAAMASGESTRYIQAFSAAIGRTGGDVEESKKQLMQFAATVEQFRLHGGLPGIAQYSSQLGVNANTAKPQEIIEGVMRMIERNPGEQGRQFMINEVAGKIGMSPDMMTSLIQIGTLANLQAAIQESIRIGAVTSKEQIEAAIKFQEAVTKFQQAVNGLKNALIPFEWMAKHINQITENVINPGSVTARPEGTGEKPTDISDPNKIHINLNSVGRWIRSWFGGGSPSSAAPQTGTDPSLVPSGTGAGRSSGAPGTLTDAQRTWANAIAGGEAPDYNIRYGERAGRGTLDLTGPHPGLDKTGHSASGKYQFIQSTWMEAIGALGLPNVMSPENQDAAFGYLLKKHGVTDAMMSDPSRRGEVVDRLRGEWPSLPGGSQQNTTTEQLNRRLNQQRTPSPQASPRVEGATPEPGGAGTIWDSLRRLREPSADPIVPRQMLRPENMMSPSAPSSSNSSTENHIGAVNVYPPSGDSKTIAQTIKQDIARELLATANTGMV